MGELAEHRVRRFPIGFALAEAPLIAESRSNLWAAGEIAELRLQAGKVQNLRVAVQRLNGVEIPAGHTFSFWKQIGRTRTKDGYVEGRELREGCIIPNIGGGLCQLSNALYDAALKAHFEIVERHAHSQRIPGSMAQIGRDATVFWNYVDLRFRAQKSFRIEAELTASELIVCIRAADMMPPITNSTPRNEILEASSKSCASCGVMACFRARPPIPERQFGHAIWMVEENWPEFKEYAQIYRAERDLVVSGTSSLIQKLKFRSRIMTGVTLAEASLLRNESQARFAGQLLKYEVLHATVTQETLPYLWRDGHLGGRTFDVFMTRLPLQALHAKLQSAAQRWPESTTLNEYRASAELELLEIKALRAARKIITPHREIARHVSGLGLDTVLLDWHNSVNKRAAAVGGVKNRIVFPCATLARKGAYELREAARELSLNVGLLGPKLESKDFWSGIRTYDLNPETDWLAGVTAVVELAWVEHQPRKLLEALAKGVPVVASHECGLGERDGLYLINAGDTVELTRILHEICR